MPSFKADARKLDLKTFMDRWPQTIPVFIEHKVLCVGCAISPYQTIENACREHGLNEDVFRRELIFAIEKG